MRLQLRPLASFGVATSAALLFAAAVRQPTAAPVAEVRGGQQDEQSQQDEQTQQAAQGPQAGQGRGGRGGEQVRQFLGLGRAPDPAIAARGEKFYAASCAFCHGADARGAEGPNLVRAEIVLHDEAGESIGPVLLEGRLDAGMPAFPRLTRDQITEIAEFLHLQVENAANRGLYGSMFANRDILTGDAKAGEAYFNSAGGCRTCHSPTGDLAHVGSKYQPANLQNRWLWPGGSGTGNRDRGRSTIPVKATVTLPSGETVSGIVKRLDDFDIAITDSQGRYRSWSREGVTVEVADPLGAHRQLLAHYADADVHNVTAYLATLK